MADSLNLDYPNSEDKPELTEEQAAILDALIFEAVKDDLQSWVELIL